MPVESKEKKASRKTVLFVDDSLLFLDLMELLVREHAKSWDVLLAKTAQHAMQLFEVQKIDMIVTDLQIPGMSGIELLTALRAQRSRLVKVVLTAHATEQNRREALQAGAEFFLEKPSDNQGFKALLMDLQKLVSLDAPKGFRGMLAHVELTALIQMLCLGQGSIILEILSEDIEGKVFIKEGAIVHAQSARLSGLPALSHLLFLTGGEFNLFPYEEPATVTINAAWDMLLMEAMQSKDEMLNLARSGEELPK